MADSDSKPVASHHMSSEEFRRHGHAMIDWIARYLDELEHAPVQSSVMPGEIRQQLPPHPPECGEPFEAMMRDVDAIIRPGITNWQSPSFFGYFPCNNSGPSILGELLSAGLGIQGMLWSTSPACTELETHVLDWVAEMLDLPARFRSDSTGGGVIQDTASSAALCALLAGRERATDFAINERGGTGLLTAYCSEQSHSSIEKAVKIAGLGRGNLRLIETNDHFAMNPRSLARSIDADLKDGLTPCFVCATVGTTSSGAVDPVREIGRTCRDRNIWLHVDAAMSGTAAVCPEFRFIHDGLELADSYCFNPHKWMFTNFDCNCFYVADRAALINTLTIMPEYLRNTASESGAVIDYRDWQVPLGRRFRALKLWFVIRHYGIEGLRALVREHVRLTHELAENMRTSADLELIGKPALNLLCFAHRDGDEATRALHESLNATGRVFLTHTKLRGRYVLRMSIGATRVEARHVDAAWALIREHAAGASADPRKKRRPAEPGVERS